MKMKYLIIVIILFLSKTSVSQTNNNVNQAQISTDEDIEILTIDQKYEGKNVFVNNPFSTRNEGGFCITDVIINNSPTPLTKESINATSFEVELNKYNLKLGDIVSIQIYHQKGCKPTIMKFKTVDKPE